MPSTRTELSGPPDGKGSLSEGAKRVVNAGAETLIEGASRAREAVDHGVDSLKRGTLRAQEGAHRAVDRVDQAVGETRAQVECAVGTARQRLAQAVRDARVTLEDLGEKKASELAADVGALVRKHPGKAVLIAAALGFFVGARLRPRA